MFEFLKKKNKKDEVPTSSLAPIVDNSQKIVVGNNVVNDTVSSKYNRSLYENKSALEQFRNDNFANKTTITDPYTNQKLYKTQAESKQAYGENFTKHVADIDHTVPLKAIYEKCKYNPFLNDSDIQKIANMKENYQAISANMNRSKGGLTSQLVSRENYSSEVQNNLLIEEAKANKAIQDTIFKSSAKNATKMAGKSFVIGSGIGAAVSGVQNIKDYQSGEIDGKTAALNVATDSVKSGGKAAVMTVAVKSAEGIIAKKASNTIFEKSCQSFIKSNGVAKAGVCVIEAGKSISKYINGELDEKELAGELTEKGTALTTSFVIGAQGMALGSIIGTAIFPGIGTIIGSFVGDLAGNLAGYTLGKELFNQVKDYKQFLDNYNPEKLARYREIYKHLEETTRYQREALKVKLEFIYNEQANSILNSMFSMKESLLNDDNDGFNDSLECLCNLFGLELRFKSQDEFDNFMNNDEIEEW